MVHMMVEYVFSIDAVWQSTATERQPLCHCACRHAHANGLRAESRAARRDVPAGRSCRRVHAFARARARIWAELRAGRKPSAADLERWAGNAVSTVLAKRARQRGDGGARQRHFPDAPPVLPMRTRKPGHHQSEPFCFTAVMVTTGAYSSRREADARKVISSATRS